MRWVGVKAERNPVWLWVLRDSKDISLRLNTASHCCSRVKLEDDKTMGIETSEIQDRVASYTVPLPANCRWLLWKTR